MSGDPLIDAVLDVTPYRFDGVCAADDCALANACEGAPELAARQVAAVLRALAVHLDGGEWWPERLIAEAGRIAEGTVAT